MKTGRWKTMMVAVRDFDAQAKALLRKAAALAQRFGASLEVLHISTIAEETFRIPGLLVSPESLEELAVIQRRRLDTLVKPLLKSGLKVTCLSIMDYPPADAIVRQVQKRKPDLLIAQSQRHSTLARVFLSNTDWELIRNCPCPLWLVKTSKLKPALSVLAAVDPFHAFAKPADLDADILAAAGQVVGTGPGRMGICHAYTLPQDAIAAMGEVAMMPVSAAQARRYKAQVAEATRRISKQYAVARKDQLLVEGDPAHSIPQLARRWKADLLVMGALSRRGLKRAFIGNTAERALDEATCDVLVIKPRGFKNTVSSRSG